jgi:aspartyl-tRNA(Asn)/glutamyl-tRNA(Gln) amidotransferase subunit A
MSGKDDPFLGLCHLASLIAQKQITSAEATEALLSRIARYDGELNSYITVMGDSARSAAAKADKAVNDGRPLGRLHGVPIAVKDLYATKGVRTTFACAAFADWVPDYDASVVERMMEAGAIIVGKLNLHEAASGTSSLVSHSGPVHNPWNTDYVAGGSSGGSGAAVAAGLAYGALGSDTAMSIRHPAAYCGIVGLKPTYGRVSKRGALPLSWSLDHVGPMTRTVRDAALMLQVMAAYDPRDPSSRDEPVPDYMAPLEAGIRGLRLGIARVHFFEQCEDETLAAVEKAIHVLRELGAQAETCELPYAEDATLVGRTILMAEAAAYHAQRLKDQPHLLGPELQGLLGMGSMFSAVQYLQAQRSRNAIASEFAQVMRNYDVLVMPTTPLAPCKAKEDGAQLSVPRMRNTMPFNLTGLPAISLPCGFTRDGLPIGLQIVGRPFDEATILQCANSYERATAWHTQHPKQFQ